MKIFAAIFASIALFAALLGFAGHTVPLVIHLAKFATVLATAGFLMTALAYVMDELLPTVAFEVSNISRDL